MRSLNVLSIFIGLTVLGNFVNCQDDAAGKRSSLLNRRPPSGRNSLFGKATTTTTTTQQPLADYDDLAGTNGDEQLYDTELDGENKDSIAEIVTLAPSTPEPTRKPPGPTIRPFRTNDALLQALRRRQQSTRMAAKGNGGQQIEAESIDVQTVSTTEKVTTKSNERTARKRFGSRGAQTEQDQSQQSVQPESTEPTAKRPGRSRFGFNKSN